VQFFLIFGELIAKVNRKSDTRSGFAAAYMEGPFRKSETGHARRVAGLYMNGRKSKEDRA
jgi:hypothetical protein